MTADLMNDSRLLEIEVWEKRNESVKAVTEHPYTIHDLNNKENDTLYTFGPRVMLSYAVRDLYLS